MSKKGRTHEENLKLVCAVCTNLRGKKASRGVSNEEEKDIQKFVLNPTINVQSTSLKASATLALFTFASLGEQQKRRVPFCFFLTTTTALFLMRPGARASYTASAGGAGLPG